MLWHSGQGGEIARGYYGPVRSMGRRAPRGDLVERLFGAFTGRRPGREAVLNATGARLVREHLHGWVQEQLDAGAAPADVPDLFYLERRMATWAGPSHGCVEPVKDTTSALWSRRLLAHELGASTGERSRELFALRVLERLAPAARRRALRGRAAVARPRGPAAPRAGRVRVAAGQAAAESCGAAPARATRLARPVPTPSGRCTRSCATACSPSATTRPGRCSIARGSSACSPPRRRRST